MFSAACVIKHFPAAGLRDAQQVLCHGFLKLPAVPIKIVGLLSDLLPSAGRLAIGGLKIVFDFIPIRAFDGFPSGHTLSIAVKIVPHHAAALPIRLFQQTAGRLNSPVTCITVTVGLAIQEMPFHQSPGRLIKVEFVATCGDKTPLHQGFIALNAVPVVSDLIPGIRIIHTVFVKRNHTGRHRTCICRLYFFPVRPEILPDNTFLRHIQRNPALLHLAFAIKVIRTGILAVSNDHKPCLHGSGVFRSTVFRPLIFQQIVSSFPDLLKAGLKNSLLVKIVPGRSTVCGFDVLPACLELPIPVQIIPVCTDLLSSAADLAAHRITIAAVGSCQEPAFLQLSGRGVKIIAPPSNALILL